VVALFFETVYGRCFVYGFFILITFKEFVFSIDVYFSLDASAFLGGVVTRFCLLLVFLAAISANYVYELMTPSISSSFCIA